MSIELITMGASAVGGFALKYMATQAENRHQQMVSLMKSRRIANEVDGGEGRWVRRFIVLVMMGIFAFIVIAPAVMDANAVIIDDGWFFTTTTEVHGIVYDGTIKQILVGIIGFYFGTSAATK